MSYPVRRLRGRYRSLALIETFNAVILLPGMFWFFGWPLTVANLSGAVACGVLLLAGAAYWATKVRQLDERTMLPRGLGAFAVLRPIGWVLSLGALLLVVVLRGPNGIAWLPGLGTAVLAVLEQINYFHVQLSHDNPSDLARLFRSGLRSSKLARDLAARRTGTPPPGLRFPDPGAGQPLH
ncbi:hypothetical protein BI335_06930 [Enemella evansiae]|uniref:hypothetical protein n=1 Tax=Enemella evansiae TaxID=2016499 RepID=UPI000B96C1F6|nr:hypothetical protein [Enemella evansiae]OYO18764.1 hypothetical protein BI335_06930 [Enemella evansiae]